MAKYQVQHNPKVKQIFEDLEKYFGDFVMTFVVDWFNQEFGENAEGLTF